MGRRMTTEITEYGIYVWHKDSQGMILIPFDGSEYKVYHLKPIKINWWWKSENDNNIREVIGCNMKERK